MHATGTEEMFTDENISEIGVESEIVLKEKNIRIGKKVVVDKFNKTDDATYFFLTHAHSDHYGGLNATWTKPVYCSQVTAQLLPVLTKSSKHGPVNPNVLKPLPIGEMRELEPNLFVTLLDANHVAGSVMFLFEGASVSGGYVLCTGDIRADNTMLEWMDNQPIFRKLTQLPLAKVFLDNTYVNCPQQEFHTKQMLIPEIINHVLDLPHCYFIISMYKLGKEEILLEIAKNLGELIALDSFRFEVRHILFPQEDVHLFVSGQDDTTRFRTCQRGKTDGLWYKKWKEMGRDVRVLDLTMQKFMIEGKTTIPVEDVIHFDYTDHSSPNELRKFVSKLKIGELIPHSANVRKDVWEELKSHSTPVGDWDVEEYNKMISGANRDIHLLRESQMDFGWDDPIDDYEPLMLNGVDLNELCPPKVRVATEVYKCEPIQIIWE